MIELCSNYTTTGYPDFKPVCKLGFRAGLWCHSQGKPHHCGKYIVLEKQGSLKGIGEE